MIENLQSRPLDILGIVRRSALQFFAPFVWLGAYASEARSKINSIDVKVHEVQDVVARTHHLQTEIQSELSKIRGSIESLTKRLELLQAGEVKTLATIDTQYSDPSIHAYSSVPTVAPNDQEKIPETLEVLDPSSAEWLVNWLAMKKAAMADATLLAGGASSAASLGESSPAQGMGNPDKDAGLAQSPSQLSLNDGAKVSLTSPPLEHHEVAVEMGVTHQDYQDVNLSPDPATFERRLIEFAKKMGFEYISVELALDRPGDEPILVCVGNTPGALKDTVRDPRDPVRKFMKLRSWPFTYDQSLYVNENASDLGEKLASIGYKAGMALALHLPGGRHFMLRVDRRDPLPTDDLRVTRMLADLQLLAVYAQESAIRVLLPEAPSQEGAVHLSSRELEVLKWTRDGKSSWAIGQILALSEHTVNHHLREVTRKLGVAGKHMAVLRAISLGLI